jgi:ribose 5-phosphate isomerase RpiB
LELWTDGDFGLRILDFGFEVQSKITNEMIFTARQLEDLHKGNGSITLPYRARLTPLAQDWLRQKKIAVGYADVDLKTPVAAAEKSATSLAISRPFLWWCDGPCGPAKAALMAQAKETSLGDLDIAHEANSQVSAIKKIAEEIKTDRAVGAILLVKTGAEAMVYANRCPSLRAILGTCIDAVEQGVSQVSANVLVIEHPYQTLQQVKNLLSRFVRGKRELREEVKARLKELATCG